jgi:hypothetical protein
MAGKPNDFAGAVTLDQAIQKLQKLRESKSGDCEIWLEPVSGDIDATSATDIKPGDEGPNGLILFTARPGE